MVARMSEHGTGSDSSEPTIHVSKAASDSGTGREGGADVWHWSDGATPEVQKGLAGLLAQGTFEPAAARTAATDRVISWLEEKWGAGPHGGACPFCGVGKWAVGAVVEIATVQPQDDGGAQFRALAPFIPVGCANCGQTTLINAVLSGVVEIPAEPQSAESSDA